MYDSFWKKFFSQPYNKTIGSILMDLIVIYNITKNLQLHKYELGSKQGAEL